MAHKEFLKAPAHHDHEQHEGMVRWPGKSFDPEDARTSIGSLSILTGSRKNRFPAPETQSYDLSAAHSRAVYAR
jgi:hypothetical protein